MERRPFRLLVSVVALVTGVTLTAGTGSPAGASTSATPKLSLGQYHSCALKSDATVWCWGENEEGQLGDGSTTDRLEPTEVDITDVVDIAAGYEFTCALKVDGTVWCWGDGQYGQLGNGSIADQTEPVQVGSLGDATSIAAGGWHACAAKDDDTAVCWGWNGEGELGDGTNVNSSSPVEVDGLTDVVELTLGEEHSCARIAGGTAKCWGDNEYGQLGNDDDNTDSSNAVGVVHLPIVVDLDAGAWHTCARTSNGRVWCWGRNYRGQLGDGTDDDSDIPVVVTGLTNAVSITANGFFSCAERAEGSVVCWGRNYDGQLGDLSQIDRSEFVRVEGLSNPTSIDTGQWHTCAILANGSIECWGDNESGQLGDGTRVDTRGVVEATAIDDLNSISGGYDHSCAIGSALIWCWGDNEYGQLGDDSTDVHLLPGLVDDSAAIIGTGQLSSGDSYSCAVTLGREAWCWGYNGNGQLGDGTTSTSNVPVQLGAIDLDGAGPRSSDPNVFAGIDAGWGHTCAIASYSTPWDPSVWCWGENRDGQLGDGTTSDSTSPVQVVGLGDVSAIGVGYSHSCAMKSTDRTVWCWGENQYGQLGRVGLDSTSPVQVTGITNATAIAVGKWSTCALLIDKTVKCWGWGESGELGDGSFLQRNIPVSVTDLTNAVDIVGGEAFRCVLIDDGTVKCWGRNADGQLGDLTAVDRNTPVQVEGLDDVDQIFEGLFNVCALTDDDDMLCWGDNEGGQLGDGTTVDTRGLVTVSGLNLLSSSSGGGRSHGGGGGGGSSGLGPTYTVSLDPAGGVCTDAGSHSTAWNTRFAGQRAIPGPADCSRAGYRLSGWANPSTPAVVLPLETETNASGQIRYVVRANLSLVAVWSPMTPPISDFAVFANFGCSSCTNAWVYFTRPAFTTDFEVTIDGVATACTNKGFFFDLALCELTSLAPGSTIDIGATPTFGDIRGPRATTRLTLNG